MLVLVASTSFVDVVVDFHGEIGVLYLGAGVSLIVAALTVHSRLGHRPRQADRDTSR